MDVGIFKGSKKRIKGFYVIQLNREGEGVEGRVLKRNSWPGFSLPHLDSFSFWRHCCH